MANLRDIRKRRRSAASTKKITRTMELVSSSKLQKAQAAAAASRPYADGLRALVAKLAEATDGGTPHALMRARPVKQVAIGLVCSDRGLCGAFNVNLTALAIRRAREWEAKGAKVSFIALGRKGGSTLRFAGYEPTSVHSGLTGGQVPFAKVEPVADAVIARFLAGEVDLVEVVYSRFINQARQVPDHLVLLPAGGDAVAADAPKASHDGFEFIPSPEELFASLIPQTVKSALFSAVLQTTAAEHAARRVAMKNAADAASDMVKDLTRVYNRGRQGKITQEIAEITGAVEAMA